MMKNDDKCKVFNDDMIKRKDEIINDMVEKFFFRCLHEKEGISVSDESSIETFSPAPMSMAAQDSPTDDRLSLCVSFRHLRKKEILWKDREKPDEASDIFCFIAQTEKN